jgi:hypothetical protein
MKRLVALVGCVVLFALTGCQKLSHDEERAVEAVIEGGGEFPQFLVGRWKDEKKTWEFVFEPDGTISSVVDSVFQERLRPNQTTEVRGRGGEPGIFEAGECELYYDPESREISATIEIKRVYMEIGGGILDGTCDYFVAGNVWEDEETWEADIYTLLNLAVLLPDPNSVGEEPTFKHSGFLKGDPNEDNYKHLIFTKVEMAPAIPDGNAANNK